ncbi:DUF4190 domain-containing protein [Actinomycetospora sp. NBRC 106378]|uniref:DUF4190 domain-containing protein n=1 Tax=Actinomycetospora sp. NBRC 106378 TaxID=3032208 RepID=UPI0024A52D70|nr:DUF4190 domain-containing protein [Actinomycetospora sp. NBRC 106378]GLZ51789.1 hypothetical protein Acsp07_14060 [Actinomycetospora sp. NBRC 106378]
MTMQQDGSQQGQYGHPSQYGWVQMPAGGVPVPPPEPRNGLATAGFVVALIGAVFALIPLVGIVSWVISPVGLVLSIAGIVAATRHGVGRGLAIAGAVLGVIGLIICLAWVAAIGSAASKAPSYSSGSYSSGSYGSSSSSSGSSAASLPAGTYGAGTYAVGSEIQPGTYRTTGASYCYWARLKSADGELGSIIANDNVDGSSTMVVKSTDQYIEFSGSCTWTKK